MNAGLWVWAGGKWSVDRLRTFEFCFLCRNAKSCLWQSKVQMPHLDLRFARMTSAIEIVFLWKGLYWEVHSWKLSQLCALFLSWMCGAESYPTTVHVCKSEVVASFCMIETERVIDSHTFDCACEGSVEGQAHVRGAFSTRTKKWEISVERQPTGTAYARLCHR